MRNPQYFRTLLFGMPLFFLLHSASALAQNDLEPNLDAQSLNGKSHANAESLYPYTPKRTEGKLPSTHTHQAYAFAGITDKGVVRPKNEDSFWVDAQAPVFLVADGMGGHEAGEIASGLASMIIRDWSLASWSQAISNLLPYARTMWVSAAFHVANQAIYARSAQHSTRRGMGTTAVAAVLTPTGADIINLGDSRAYLVKDKQIQQISHDHSLLQKYIDEGVLRTKEEIEAFPYKNIITQAMGTQPNIIPDIFPVKLAPNDQILLCSDGLTNELSEREIAQILNQNASLKEKAQTLVQEAKTRGAKDNVTAVIIQIEAPSKP